MDNNRALKMVSDYYKVSEQRILGPGKTKTIVKARRVWLYIVFFYYHKSIKELSLEIKKPVTTIRKAELWILKEMQLKPSFNEELQRLFSLIK